ncbi:M1 family metallopeptidase [Sphaerisporangium fuscum]|uniref:M1 family metallopeptidase n=1 Tax=Sphaerisporangium fuscum TaxID=2835868 RepID=UPI001BDBB32E|nr:M1 family metallopeptidase [Sphaerisporangium fuscum]
MQLKRPKRLTTVLLSATVLGVNACSPSIGATAPSQVANPGNPPAGAGMPGAAGIGDPDFPKDGNGGYDVDHYALKLAYDPPTQSLSGTASVKAKAVQSLSRFDLDLHGFTVRKVTVDGRDATFTRDGDELVITPSSVIADGTTFTVAVDYAGKPDPVRNSSNLGTYGFIPTKDGAFVTSEPNGARTWFPCNDHPADKATYDFDVTVPAGTTVVANGEMRGAPVTSGGRSTFSWREGHPMATYLATITLGKFDVKTGKTADGIPLYAAVDPTYRRNLDFLYSVSSKVTDYWSKVFGPYPFSSTGGVIDDFAAGYALENQTKPMYGGFDPDESIIAHELAHQWFGDSLSVKRWKDLWLNEGFATYAEWLWSEHNGGATAQATFDDYYADTKAPIWQYPPGVAQPKDLFNGSVYIRGAMTLQALRQRIGDQTFFTLLRTWTDQHKYGNVTTDEFVKLAEKLSGQQLDALFDAWLFKPVRPSQQ